VAGALRIRMWQSPRDLTPTDLTVVACTPHFFGADYVHPFSLPEEWGTAVHCDFTDDLGRIHDADALWFHAPTTFRLPKQKRPGQPWILMSMESDANYPLLRDRRFLDLFDLHMTYRLDSDIPAPYPNRLQYGSFTRPPMPTPLKSACTGLALYTASNPVPHRDQYVRELSRHVAVDCPGKCLNNMTVPGFIDGTNSWTRRGFESIMDILPRYKFYLAFENSSARDYVTERLFLALAAGVVPVYMGAGNVRDFLPSDDAAIVAAEFESPAELGEYLDYLDANDQAYEKHLAWKSSGFRDQFKALLNVADVEPRYRMAVKLAHGCSRECGCGGRNLESPA